MMSKNNVLTCSRFLRSGMDSVNMFKYGFVHVLQCISTKDT